MDSKIKNVIFDLGGVLINLDFVLLVGRTEDENWCMDPMHTEPELVPLSQYGNDIASIRYLIEPSSSESKAAD